MQNFFQTIQSIFRNTTLKKKILITLGLLVFIPVPFVDITTLVSKTLISDTGIEYFAMLL
jgi:hypothetical protein